MVDYSITELDIQCQGLTKLPDDIDKYTNLEKLYCSNNKITNLDNLPPKLVVLYCGYNSLASLDNLPPNLKVLYCNYNKITSLDNLPTTLEKLDCSYNKITSLDNLLNGQLTGHEDKPLGFLQNLKELYCRCNKLTSLDNLPLKLEVLYCDDNPLKYDFKPTLENIRNYNASRKLSSNT